MPSNLLIDLKKLPTEIVEKEISSYLNLNELISTVKTCNTTNQLFQQPLLARKALTLLQYVIAANYVKVAQIVRADASLMFKEVEWILNRKLESVSPVKYAFFVNDTYMWRIFLSSIVPHSEQLERFLQIAKEQTHHLDLSPLYLCYDQFAIQLEEFEHRFSYLRFDYTSDEEWSLYDKENNKVQAALLKIGAKQRECLPIHLLKEFCRTGNASSREIASCSVSIFDMSNLLYPEACRISIKCGDFTLLDISHLGAYFVLIRGHHNYTSAVARSDTYSWGDCESRVSDALKSDRLKLHDLYKKKCIEFKEIKINLEKVLEQFQKNTNNGYLIR